MLPFVTIPMRTALSYHAKEDNPISNRTTFLMPTRALSDPHTHTHNA